MEEEREYTRTGELRPRNKKSGQLLIIVLSVLVLVSLAIGATGIYYYHSTTKMRKIMRLLKDNFYIEMTDKEWEENLMKGLAISTGNQFTMYLTPEEYSASRERDLKDYYGIGVELYYSVEQKHYVISEVYEQSPAEKAGLNAGDIFASVDDIPIKQFADIREIADHIKGDSGTSVKIGILRDEKELSFDVARGQVNKIFVRQKALDDEIGYVYISEFSDFMPEQFEEAILELVDAGYRKIVLDLRGNPGGSVTALTRILDDLLPSGIMATQKGREDGRDFEAAMRSDDAVIVPEDTQFAILVNELSASASEFFSGAMRDRLDVPLIGKNTFGKGVATRVYELADGSAIQIPFFEYRLPKNDSVQGIGIPPTIEVDLEVKNKPLKLLELEEDNQLQAAIKYLRENQG